MGITGFDKNLELDELQNVVDRGSGALSIAQRQANALTNLGINAGTAASPGVGQTTQGTLFTKGTAGANSVVVLGANKNIDTMEIDTLNVGASGTAGALSIFPGTASKGKALFTASNNSGNTTTTVNVAAQAGTRTYTVPDAGASATFLMSTSTQAADGLFATAVSLLGMRNTDGTLLATSASAGKFGLAITVGTSQNVVTEAANNNTKTDTLIFDYVLPQHYVAGQNFNVVVNQQVIIGSGTLSVQTLTLTAYDITQSASTNIGPAAQNLTNSAGNLTFAITGTSCLPGDLIQIQLQTVLTETSAHAVTAQLNTIIVK